MESSHLPPLDGPGSNANDFMKWLQNRPEAELAPSAQALFKKILDTASQPRNSTKDACVKLCGFVQLCLKSNQEPLRQWAFSEHTAKDLFNYYIEWNEKDQHRSMRLVLDVLSILIPQNPSIHVRDSLKANFLSTVVSIIARQSMRPLAKSCITALNHWVSRSVFTLDDTIRQYASIRPDMAGLPSIDLWHSWVAEVFKWMELHYICPVAGKFLVTILSGLYASSAEPGETAKTEIDARVIRKWLETALSARPDILESVKNYVFAPLFKSDRALSIALLKELNNTRPAEQPASSGADMAALIHLAALEVGKKSAIVDDPSPTGDNMAPNVVILDQEVLEHFLVHDSHDVRSFAMSLLITSSSSTKPYSRMAFVLLRRHLRSCHTDSDAKFRNEILGHSKNMFKRIKGAISVLQKDIRRSNIKVSKFDANGTPVNTHISKGAKQIANAGESWLRESLRAHEEFLDWYLEFLRQELVPTASYQRHIASLKSLVNILRICKESPSTGEERIYHEPQWIRTIMDLIMDPFDDVRETATGLLMLFPKEALHTQKAFGTSQNSVSALDILAEFVARAAGLASRTSRADHSDGTARAIGLLCAWQDTLDQRLSLLLTTLDDLEDKIELAESDLGHAVMTKPVHGAFAAVRYMWEVLSQNIYSPDELERLAKVQVRIVSLCKRVWEAVSYVLCDDSPEGHLPEELEEIEGLDTKGLLSYSFRSVHESSNLLRTIVGNLRFSRANGPSGCIIPPPEVFKGVGNLAFSQLSTLRHRGAFSSVSLTFTCCCQHAQNRAVAFPAGEHSLLDSWYKGTLSCIYTQRSTTRRSAGIPSLITGILASNSSHPSFQEVMKMLQEIAARPARMSETDGSNLPQVHAFNCIKEVFKTSLLSKNAELYLPECLQLATSSLKCEVWAIRNCALLLLRSLIDTLFGTNESKSAMETGWDGRTLRISYIKYSSLPPILLSLLKSGEQAMEPGTLTQSSAAESVFPVMEIIRRAGPPESHRDALYGYIVKYLGSRQWHVREIAARTLCSFLLNGDWLLSIQRLLEESHSSANRLHGTLLTVKFFLERTVFEMKDEQILSNVKTLYPLLDAFQKDALISSETAAAWVEVQNILREVSPSETQTSRTDVTEFCSISAKRSHFGSKALLNTRVGYAALQQAATSKSLDALKACLFDGLDKDTDTACALLEAVPVLWGTSRAADLCTLYMDVCKHTTVPEARAVALTNLAGLMDEHISNNSVQDLPSPQDLDAFQIFLQHTMSPALANALILASGPIMASHALRHNNQLSFFTFDQRLRCWGKAVSDALADSNTFDIRMAAARSLKSFAAAVRTAAGSDAAYLPFLLALYSTLVDDDEEIRDVGSLATALVLSSSSTPQPQALVAVDAADALLAWMRAHFGRTNEFRAYVACRLVGEPLVAVDVGVQDLAAWVGPGRRFADALRVDESLFAVEEQNLFIDEVRETERWAGIFDHLEWDYDDDDDGGGGGGGGGRVVIMDSSLSALDSWTRSALGLLEEQVLVDDGPLGWASNPDAFALCHRVLVCGRVLSRLPNAQQQTVRDLLDGIRERGRGSCRLHGLLLSALEQSPAWHGDL